MHMLRREVLTVGGGLTVAMAGCLGVLDDGLDTEEINAIDQWLVDTLTYLDPLPETFGIWIDQNQTIETTVVENLHTESEELLDRWESEIDSKRDDILASEAERNVGEYSHTVDGEELLSVLDDLQVVLDASMQGTNAILEANGDLDMIDDAAVSTMSTVVDEGPEVIESADELWFEGPFE